MSSTVNSDSVETNVNGKKIITHLEFLPADLESVGRARDIVRSVLPKDDFERLEQAALLVSEVVSNAIIHVGGKVTFSLVYENELLKVEVQDVSHCSDLTPGLPKEINQTSGRGLKLVNALSLDWGSKQTAEGKIVWFVI